MSDDQPKPTLPQLLATAAGQKTKQTAQRAMQLAMLAHLSTMDTYARMFGATDMEMDEILSAENLMKIKSMHNAGLFLSLGSSPVSDWPMITIMLIPSKDADDAELDQLQMLHVTSS